MRRAAIVLLVVALACGRSSERTGGPAECSGTGTVTLRRGVLTVGSDLAYAPFESFDPASQKPVGFDVDLLTEVAKRAGLQAEFVNQTFSGIIAGLLAKRYDVVASAMTITQGRLAQLCFSDPYLDANQSLVVQAKAASRLASTDALSAKVVGVQTDTTGEAWVNEHLKAKARTIKSYETADDAFLDLKAGKVDALVHDHPVNLYRQKLDPAFAVVEEIPTGERYGIAVHPESRGLRDAINRALREIRADGTYDRIYESWFGRRLPSPRT